MKKKVLFVMNNLRVGGAEKALVSLLDNFDYNQYEVDLQLFTADGLFLKQLTEKVKLLPEIDEFSYYDMPFFRAVTKALKKRKFNILFNRVMAVRIFRSRKNPAEKEQHTWRYISNGIPQMKKKYDAAIGYLEKMPTYYVVEKVEANVKIGLIHNDYKALQMDPDIDRKYFPHLDYIATDSEECKNILVEIFPEEKNKIVVLPIIVSPGLIHQLALAQIPENFSDTINIISVGRLSPQKGYEFGIDALKIIKDKGLHFHWTILGTGPLEEKLKAQIAKNGLDKHISFLGIRENHYPYVRKADIFMQTSLFEGKSVAIDEAKILCRPILVTDFDTARNQIEHGVTGIIARQNAQSVSEKLEILIRDENMRNKLSSNLKKNDYGTVYEINRLYRMINKCEPF